jgi:DNA processing protein
MDYAKWTELYQKHHFVNEAEAHRVWEISLDEGIRWSWPGENDYPAGWTNLLDKVGPPLFSYKGEPVWTQWPLISVVGSRTPMRDTCLWMQMELPRFLALEPAAVVSGGARGVDQWAHRLCMDAGRPTVCVFPSGLHNPYPPGFEGFSERILATGGALVSTYALEQGMRKRFFLERNRWIAALSTVTFVVEANRRSGSSMTAKLAREEEREVCTLPVFPRSVQGLGNLDLLNEKASMIRDHQDLLGIFRLNKWRLSPGSLERLEGDGEENKIHQPQADRGGQSPAAGHALGGDIQDPVADQRH